MEALQELNPEHIYYIRFHWLPQRLHLAGFRQAYRLMWMDTKYKPGEVKVVARRRTRSVA